jgi:hypothetical protein
MVQEVEEAEVVVVTGRKGLLGQQELLVALVELLGQVVALVGQAKVC